MVWLFTEQYLAGRWGSWITLDRVSGRRFLGVLGPERFLLPLGGLSCTEEANPRPPLCFRERRPMARVTVEDCIDKVENRFELVLVASHRARMISSGQQITVDRDNDKNPVVALREIADETLAPEDLKEDLIHSLQKHVEVDEPEAEVVPALTPAAADMSGSADGDLQFDRMTEEDLLRGLEGLVPPAETEDDGE